LVYIHTIKKISNRKNGKLTISDANCMNDHDVHDRGQNRPNPTENLPQDYKYDYFDKN